MPLQTPFLPSSHAAVGSYELHLTVQSHEQQDQRLEALCYQLGCQCLIIELSRGQTIRQPMVTQRMRSSWQEARSSAARLARDLRRAGFPPLRIKIEAELTNAEVPITDELAQRRPERYFEHHVRLRLPPDGDLVRLGRLVDPWGAHLSRNLRSRATNGEQLRFVTLRSRGVGKPAALEHLQTLLAVITEDQVEITDCSSEYVVHDSRIALDLGWLAAPPNDPVTHHPLIKGQPCGIG